MFNSTDTVLMETKLCEDIRKLQKKVRITILIIKIIRIINLLNISFKNIKIMD